MAKPGELFQDKYAGMSILTEVYSVYDEEGKTWTTYGKVKLGRSLDTEHWEFGEQGVRCTDSNFQKSYVVVGEALQRIVAGADDTFFTEKPELEEKKEETD